MHCHMISNTNIIFVLASLIICFLMLLNVDANNDTTIPEDYHNVEDNSYQSFKELREALLSPQKYTTALRPVLDQSKPIIITGFFSLVAIVSLDDVGQVLVTNGFLTLAWQDDFRRWSWTDDGTNAGPEEFELRPKDVWRPSMQIINAVDGQDPFADKNSYTLLANYGHTAWTPGGLFHTFCNLDLRDFPFDVQKCYIEMCPINHNDKTMVLDLEPEVNMAFHFPNAGWELIESNVTKEKKPFACCYSFSCARFHFKLKRRPTTIVLNVILPAVLISLLNNFVFIIPLESGENIGYSITVLLSLTVFLSTASSMMPQVSDVVPSLTIYLFILLLTSVISVAIVIFTEHLHYEDEDDDTAKSDANHKDIDFHNTSSSRRRGTNLITSNSNPNLRLNIPRSTNPATLHVQDSQSRHNVLRTGNHSYDVYTPDSNDNPNIEHKSRPYKKYREIARRINIAFFVIVMIIWAASTIWFFTSTNISL